jgi:hypothetical protein
MDHMCDLRNVYKILVERPETEHLRELGLDGRVILKWILKKWGMRIWTRFMWLRIVLSGGFL